MTREEALGKRPSIMSSSICFGHSGIMPLEGKEKGLSLFLGCVPSIQLLSLQGQKPGMPYALQKE